MRQNIARYTTPLITNSDNNMLWRLTHCYFNWWGMCWIPTFGTGRGVLALDDGLDAVSQELADYIFEVGEDVRECG
jgi:hypothetical protein